MSHDTRPTLLLVDDETDLIQILKAQIKDLNFNLFSAQNGEDALKIVQSQNIDAILTDINMPIMDGITFLKELRSHDFFTPVVVLSAFCDKKNTVHALRLGAMDFLNKPWEVPDLHRVLQAAVELGVAQRSLEDNLDELCKKASIPADKIQTFKKAQRAVLRQRIKNDLVKGRSAS